MSRRLSFVLRIALVAVVLAVLVFVNREYFFHGQSYDEGDQAANSLSVLRAERGQELHGQYSRWRFRHPGPAVFYGEAASELVLHRGLHLVPTPYNAQVLFITLLMVSLLAVGLSVAARWVGGWVFPVLAVAFAACHVTAANPATLLTNNWPAYVIPMTLFAFLVVTASVAAGEGRDLLLLVFTGCLLVHMHVAQPLFVGPMFGLAYAGLIVFGRRHPAVEAALPAGGSTAEGAPPPAAPPSLPWRTFRRAHGWALLIAGLFALPLLVDLAYGKESNFALILDHLRNHRGERHPYLASLDYLLRFAVYQPSRPDAPIQLVSPAATPSDLGGFVARHAGLFALWLAALLSPLAALAARRWSRQPPPGPGGGRGRFLNVLWLVWAASVGLTLFWGHIQDGPLFYFNAWFNYAILLVLALLAAGAAADLLETVTRRAARPWLWRGGVAALCAVPAVVLVHRHAGQYLLQADERIRAYTRTVLAVLDQEPAGTPPAKLLLFPDDALSVALGLAETLTRAGRPVRVLPEWGFVFGRNYVLGDQHEYEERMAAGEASFEVWHLVPDALVAAGQPGSNALGGPHTLVRGGMPVDPAAGFAINVAGADPNSPGFVGKGLSVPAAGEPAWTDEKRAWLQFRAQPVPAGFSVEVAFDCQPFLVPGKCDVQRVGLSYNGVDLGTLRLTDPGVPSVRFVISGSLWNKHPSGLLVMDLPDAVSPKETTGTEDTRPLALLIRSVKFTTAPEAEPARQVDR